MWTRGQTLLPRLFSRYNLEIVQNLKRTIQTGNPQADKLLERVAGKKIDQLVVVWEDSTKLTPYKEAQAAVLQANEMLKKARNERRVLQEQQKGIQSRLKEVTYKIEKASRGTPEYVHFITEESEIFKEDKLIAEEISKAEETERQGFESLTHAIYLVHEKGNEHREHMKSFSLVLTICGGVLGYLAAIIKVRSLNKIAGSAEGVVQECKSILTSLQSDQAEVLSFISDIRHLPSEKLDVSGDIPGNATQEDAITKENKVRFETDSRSVASQKTMELLTEVKEQGNTVNKELKEIHKLVKESHISARDSGKNVVQVGPEVQTSLQAMEENLEWRMKVLTIASASLFCGTVALALATSFFRGS